MEELDEIQALIDLYLVPEGEILATEHNSIDTAIVDYLRNLQATVDQISTDLYKNIPKNTGYFTGLDLNSGSPGDSLGRSGDVTTATISNNTSNSTSVLVTLANEMPSLNYRVETSIQSLGTLINDDNAGGGVFKVISKTQFEYSNSEMVSSTQDLRIHVKVFSLD